MVRILIITKSAWDDKIAGGNTLSNFFSGWTDATFFNIFCREAKPDNYCCNYYFSVSPINIAKNIITPWRIGNQFSFYKANENNNGDFYTEQTLSRLSKKYTNVFSTLYDAVYSTKIWLNKRIKRFLVESKPDLVFCFGVTDAFNYHLVRYIKIHHVCPIVVYFVDDVYNNSSTRLGVLESINKRRLRRLAEMANKRYAISQMMCDEYAQEMHCSFDLLYKGCEIHDILPKHNTPIRLTYAGNLLYQRDQILAKLVLAIQKLNEEQQKQVHLDIYSATSVDEVMRNQLNVDGASILHPAKPFSNIKEIMAASDIVLHVESFDENQKKMVRLSFSTKISDCIQSGAMMVAIGPKDIASIDFLTRIPGVMVVLDPNDIKSCLKGLLEGQNIIEKRARETNLYARSYMSIENVRERLQYDFNEMIDKNKN